MKHVQIATSDAEKVDPLRALHDLLEMTAAALECVAGQLPRGVDHQISFTGEWQRFGTPALRDILDRVDQVLDLVVIIPGAPRVPALAPSYYKYLSLLKHSPFERRARGGGWRFGTRRIDDCVVDVLTASGRAATDGVTVWLVKAEPAT